MKLLTKFFILLPLICSGLFWISHGYLFWLKSFDNSVENIVQIEKEFWVFLPVVSFIYDPWYQWDLPWELKKIKEQLGENRIYHISISPNTFTAQEVADGKFDTEYLTFFEYIKQYNLKVIFRTMHEMNWGWYPRSSNPETFKKAWIHVWQLSRQIGLDRSHLLFDMSVNAWDLPAKDWKTWQKSVFVHCTPKDKPKLKCPSFEDYYPGDEYVDLIGFTFYNWGKGNSNRRRGSPDKIVNNTTWQTLERIKKIWKPIFIDEVWTSAVEYPEHYDYHRSLEMYQSNKELKNAWLVQLREFLQRETKIVGAIYFNVDLTNWLQHQIIGELDWAVINLANGKFYEGFRDIYQYGKHDLASILELFWLDEVNFAGKKAFVSPEIKRLSLQIDEIVGEKYKTREEKSDFYLLLSGNVKDNSSFSQAVRFLSQTYALSGNQFSGALASTGSLL